MNAKLRTAKRLKRQEHRLRNCLATAWGRHRGPTVIRRIEALIEVRWTLIDQARTKQPQPD